ncbi:MAG: hypothetical protein CMP11_01665 [Zetaproteobacteria bacterium]|nr:hypothetical protein [Pseudobdellovibrionaceae bacterium]|tara:strand:+ start:407 stop:1075 length:669 start_codon:yes stop_codon:yes gene_type:complete
MSSKALVADESVTVQKIAKIALAKYEIKVTQAFSLEEAQEALKNESFDIHIFSGKLPGVKKPSDINQRLNAQKKKKTIILLEKNDKETYNCFQQYNFPNLVKKPFTSKAFKDAIENTCAQPKKELIKKNTNKDQSQGFVGKKTKDLKTEEKLGKNTSLNQEDDTQNLLLLDSLVNNEMNSRLPQLVQKYCKEHLSQAIEAELNKKIFELTQKKQSILSEQNK